MAQCFHQAQLFCAITENSMQKNGNKKKKKAMCSYISWVCIFDQWSKVILSHMTYLINNLILISLFRKAVKCFINTVYNRKGDKFKL